MSHRVLMDHGRMLDVLNFECDLLLDAAHRTHDDARVPACPGLTVGEVVRHLGSVYRMVCSWLVGGAKPGQWQRDPAPRELVSEFLSTGREALLRELGSRDPHAPTGTWWPQDQTTGFWRRRMMHETTVHRTDVQTAAGVAVDDVADDVAVDGIDEVLTLWFGHRLDVLGVSGTRDGSVAVSAGGQTWLARAGPALTEAERLSSDAVPLADARVSGAPMQVYLWLWGRASTPAVTTEGDDDAVAQLWALLRLATR